MKKLFFITAVVITALMGVTSCQKEGAKLYVAKILVNYPDGYSDQVASGVLVTIVNTSTAMEDTVRTNDSGIAEVSLAEGNYNISATTEADEFYFNGTTQNLFIVDGSANYFAIDLVASSKGGGLIFKEIYYAGSTTPALTKYNNDQFHEIYNNSDDTLYLDGLCIGILEPTPNNPSAWVDGTGNLLDRLPVTFHALMFPGTGKTYPIYPRTSVVLAQDAINHKSDAVNGNPNSPVDLGNAQFETFIEAPGKDTDAPSAVNLIVMYTTSPAMSDWSVYNRGSAVILFRLPTGLDYATFVANTSNFMTKPGSSSTWQYFMVDKSWVIDAVEEVYPDAASHYKRLPVSLDAGIVFCSGSNTGLGIRRKVKMILDGKVVFQDTNNSTNDFLSDVIPTPFLYPTTVDVK
jgi:hypothetical protein